MAQTLEERAIAFAQTTHDLTLVLDAEALRTRPGSPPLLEGDALDSWLVFASSLALERGLPLVALRFALEAQDRSGLGAREGTELAVEAQLAMGQAPQALERALALADSAHSSGDPATEGQAVALTGEALLALERVGDAAGAFERAADLARVTGDTVARDRRLLNAARAHLRRGDSSVARRLLEPLEHRANIDGRTVPAVTLAIALELASREEYAAARKKLEETVVSGAAVGDCETVERAEILRERLGKLGS